MLIAGACLIPVTDHAPFLNAFNIHMKSYFLTICFFGQLFYRSVDIPLRIGILWKQRLDEFEADKFGVRIGYGEASSSALIRNFASNKDILFTSWWQNFI